MFFWGLIFLMVALLSGAFGFGGVVSLASGIAQMLFVTFLILFGLAVLVGMAKGRP